MREASWWEGNYYPDAGEVIGWRERRLLAPGDQPSWPINVGRAVNPGGGVSADTRVNGPDESNVERSARRARTRLRRYAVANRLRYLWVLTFAPDGCEQYPCHHVTDLGRVKRRVASFVKRGLRSSLAYRSAYVVGYERHKSGAWHVNLLVSERIQHRLVEVAWADGNVWVSRFAPRLGDSARDASRRAASYVAKYVAKEFDGAGRYVHRYDVAQGFQLRVVRVYALSASGVIEECDAGVPGYRYDAASPESGRGPPIVWAAFS